MVAILSELTTGEGMRPTNVAYDGRTLPFRDATALRDLGLRIPVLPGGGFFVYADIGRFSRDSLRFAQDVLAATGVAFTPGVDFGVHRAQEHVRFAYTVALPRLVAGVERLDRHLRAAA